MGCERRMEVQAARPRGAERQACGMWASMAAIERLRVYEYEHSEFDLLMDSVRDERLIFHSAGPMVTKIVLAEKDFWNALGLPVRLMVRVEVGTSKLRN